MDVLLPSSFPACPLLLSIRRGCGIAPPVFCQQKREAKGRVTFLRILALNLSISQIFGNSAILPQLRSIVLLILDCPACHHLTWVVKVVDAL